MLTDQEMLRYIYQGAEMGCSSINGILPYAADRSLSDALETQRQSYQGLRHQAAAMLNQRGIEPQGAHTAAKLFSRVVSEVRAVTDTSPSHLAEMIIQGNTLSASRIQKHLNDYHAGDAHIRALAEKQLRQTQENIEQMKSFL